MSDDANHTTIKPAFSEPRKKFWVRSRKRPKSDAMSVSSMDISIESEVGKKKKRRRITEVASSIFSSTSTSSKSALHRSFTIRPNSVDLSFFESETEPVVHKKQNKSAVENSSSFTLKSWMLDVANANIKLNSNLSRKEVKRQEAIYELFCGENVLLNDLRILRDCYYEPLLTNGIFTPDEMEIVFGDINELIQIHTRLRDELIDLRDQNGCTEYAGPTILSWISQLPAPYLERCRTQVWAKSLLDEKRLTNKRFQSFLKKRLESPHSIDLWTCLDVPRSRIVKYPLLVKEILRHTPSSHSDVSSLTKANDQLSDLLKNIDKTMGDAERMLAQSKIYVKPEYDPDRCIETATELITQGQLRDTKGMKYQCYLFDKCFALTRRARSGAKKYALSFPVIPKNEIFVDTDDKSIPVYGFKVGEYIMITEDEHGKRHWIDCFSKFQKINMDTIADILMTDEKENRIDYISSKVKEPTSARTSVGKLSEHNFSSTLKRSILKRKCSSIGYI